MTVGALALAPSPVLAAGCCRAGLGAHDFDRDGNLDVVVAQVGPSGSPSTSVRVYLGNGDGTLGTPVDSAAGINPISVATGDFRAIGITDLAVANSLSGDVTISLGNGDGTFRPPVSYPVGGYPYSVVAADFNGDGILDLAVTAGGRVQVLIGNGDGTFQAPVPYLAGTNPTAMATADLAGHGVLDLMVADYVNASINVLLWKRRRDLRIGGRVPRRCGPRHIRHRQLPGPTGPGHSRDEL
jgi:hypothetical protein